MMTGRSALFARSTVETKHAVRAPTNSAASATAVVIVTDMPSAWPTPTRPDIRNGYADSTENRRLLLTPSTEERRGGRRTHEPIPLLRRVPLQRLLRPTHRQTLRRLPASRRGLT